MIELIPNDKEQRMLIRGHPGKYKSYMGYSEFHRDYTGAIYQIARDVVDAYHAWERTNLVNDLAATIVNKELLNIDE